MSLAHGGVLRPGLVVSLGLRQETEGKKKKTKTHEQTHIVSFGLSVQISKEKVGSVLKMREGCITETYHTNGSHRRHHIVPEHGLYFKT